MCNGHSQHTHLFGRLLVLALALSLIAIGLGSSGCGDGEKEVTAGLIIKQRTNPFFQKIEEVAKDTADDENVKLLVAAGKSDVDNASQVKALDDMVRRGAKGILITPAQSKAIVPAIRRARAAGVTVIALDTPTDPPSATNALFATNNVQAGLLIGRYARAKAQEDKIRPRIAMLDLGGEGASGLQRHEGFLRGFGIRDGSPLIVGSVATEGNEDKAEAGMKQLLAQNPDINVVYTVNEPAAFGAAAALSAAGKKDDDVIVVSVDGGCEGIKRGIRTGEIDATAQQYPENMAREGIKALAKAERGGKQPSGYLNTGLNLITDDPVPGVKSKDDQFGVRNCWGKNPYS